MSISAGIFPVSNNSSSIKHKHLALLDIKTTSNDTLSVTRKRYSLHTKPYITIIKNQKLSETNLITTKPISVKQATKVTMLTMPFNNALLAMVETGKFKAEKNVSKPKKTKKKVIDQKQHPLNAIAKKAKKPRINKSLHTNTAIVKVPVKALKPKKKNIDITEQLIELQKIVNNIDAKSKKLTKNTAKKKLKKVVKKANVNTNIAKVAKSTDVDKVDYWQTVYSIESKQGKLLYRPRNKAKNCNVTLGPCGHHQLTVQALRDIGCKSMQCRKDRLDFKKSLALSKQLLALNEKRLKNDGLTGLKDYERYLIHQQGANGIKNIIAAKKGKKQLSKTIKKNMANNSPFSYKQFKKMGSKVAAKKFMKHWEKKWMSEKRMILASNTKTTKRQKSASAIPRFNDNDLNFALNMMF